MTLFRFERGYNIITTTTTTYNNIRRKVCNITQFKVDQGFIDLQWHLNRNPVESLLIRQIF